MAIEYKKKVVVLTDIVNVDDAEGLLEWLQDKPSAKVDLSACTHLHPANLQVLMAARCRVTHWPQDAGLRTWLETALSAH